MHVLILGAGALGSLLGARLSAAGERLTLFSTHREHMQSIRRNGLVVEELDGALRRYRLTACESIDSIEGTADLVIVLVKSYATFEGLALVQPCCTPSTLFLTLQNGIGNWERVARVVGSGSVLVGTTAQGATLKAPGEVKHGGNGPTRIGEPQGPPTDRVRSIVDLFRRSGLEAEASDRMEQLVWEKLLVNVGINAITALTAVRNGMIAQVEAGRELCAAAVEEAVRVARARGVVVRENMADHVLSVARATASNRSSMGQDVDRGKRTEIDAINGAIVRFGEELHIPTPVNRTLTLAVKLREAGSCDSARNPGFR